MVTKLKVVDKQFKQLKVMDEWLKYKVKKHLKRLKSSAKGSRKYSERGR